MNPRRLERGRQLYRVGSKNFHEIKDRQTRIRSVMKAHGVKYTEDLPVEALYEIRAIRLGA